MKNTGRKMVKQVIVLTLWMVLVPATAGVCASSTSVLTPLVNRVAPGDQLVISSNQDNTFDSLAGNNEVVFLGPKGIPRPQKAQAVSRDGRTITVLVPAQAQSGEVTVKTRGAEIDKVNLTISDKPREYRVCLFLALIPAAFFLLVLIWLALCLKFDSAWKLSGALSEQIEQKFLLREPQPDGQVIYNYKTGEAIHEIKPIMVNSSSRLIAFIGLFVIAAEIMGVLIPAIYRYACTGEIPDLSNFSTFILAQTPIFAPYVVNKFTKKQETQEKPPGKQG